MRFFFGVLLLLIAAGPGAAQDRPNILWITTEDMSPALGAYGDAQARTPNLDRLAEQGILYRRAYASAPICAPARSTLITGIHASSLGTQHLRSAVELPEFIRTLPEYLRAHGYYTTNNSKTDYNFSPEGRWDESGSQAHWRNRPEGRPFFSVFNYGTTHEGRANRDAPEELAELVERHDPADAELPPYYPDTPEMRRIWAQNYDLITRMDQQVGALLQQLEADGLTEETIVFFFSDHGHGLPRYKRWLYDTGLRVPLIIRFPEAYAGLAPQRAGTSTDRLVSFLDFAPTVLSLTGVPIPATMQGHPFLGPDTAPPRDYVFTTRDRADDIYDLSRAAIDDRYIYIRNYMPHLPYVRPAFIFSDRKRSFAELWRVRGTETLGPFVANGEHEATLSIEHDGTLRGEVLEGLVNRIHQGLQAEGAREVSSQELGRLVMEDLREIDQVAYVRFASVYRQFKSVDDFMDELRSVIGERNGS